MDADVDSAWISTQAIVSTDMQPDNEREKINDYGCIVLNGTIDNERYILKEGDNTIGRHPLNDIYIEHPSVSMNHAVIQCDSDGVVLLDKGSLNKTKLNKKNLRKDVAYFLEENALLMFGEVQADYFINGESNEVTNDSKSIASDNIYAHKATQNDVLSSSKLSNTVVVNTLKSFRTDIPNAITDCNVSLIIRNSSTRQIEKEVPQTSTGSESAMNTLNDIHTELNSSSPSDEYLLEALSQVETMQNNIHSNKIFNNLSNKDTSIINQIESMPKITREDTPSPVMDLGSSFVTTNIIPENIFQSPNKINTELIREDTPSPVMDLGSSFVTTNKTPESLFQSPNKINNELIREDTPSPVMDFGCYNDFENKLETDDHDVISVIQSPNKDDEFNNTQVLEIPNFKSENLSISINQSFGQKQNVSMNNFKNSFDADDDDILFCESQKVESGDQSSIPTTNVFNVPSNYNLSNSNKQFSVKPADPLNITKKSGIHNDGLNNDSEQNRLTLTKSNLKYDTGVYIIDTHKRNVNTFEADDDDIFSNFIEEECKSQQQNLNSLENQDFFNCLTQKISVPTKVNEKPKLSSSIHKEIQKPPGLAQLSKIKASISNIDSNGINENLTNDLKIDNEDFFDCPTQKLSITKRLNSKPKVSSTIHKEEIPKVFEFSKPSNNNLIVLKSYSTSIPEDLTQIPEKDDDFFNCPTQKISVPTKVNEKPKLSSSIHEEIQKPPGLAQLSKIKANTSNIDSNSINENLTNDLKIDNEDFFDCPTQQLLITKRVNSKPKVPSTIHEQETQDVLEFSKPSKNNLTVLKKHSTNVHEELTPIPEMDDDFFNCPTQKYALAKKVNEKQKIFSSIHEEETQKLSELAHLSKIKASTSNIDCNGINEDLTDDLKIDNEDFFDCPTQKLSVTKKVNPKPKVSSTIHEQETQNILKFLKPSKNNLTMSKNYSTSEHEDLTQIPEMDDDFFNCPTQKISISKNIIKKPIISSSIHEEETQKSTKLTQLSKIKASTSNIDSNGINEDLTKDLKIDNEDFFDCPTQKLSVTKKINPKAKVSSTIHEQETQDVLEFSKPSKNNLTMSKNYSTSEHEDLTQIPEMDDDFFNCPTQKMSISKNIIKKPIISSSIHEEETQKSTKLTQLSKIKASTSNIDSNGINEDLTKDLKIDNEDFFDCPTQKLSVTKKVNPKPKVSSTIHEQETQDVLEFSKPSKNNLTMSKNYSTSEHEDLTQIPEMDDDFFNCPTQKMSISKNIIKKPIISSSIHEEETQKSTKLTQLSKIKASTSNIDSNGINEDLTKDLKIDNEDFFDCPTQKLSVTKKVNPKPKVSSTIHEQETQDVLEFSKPSKNNLTMSKNYSTSEHEDLTQIPEMDDDFFNCPTQKMSISKNIIKTPIISSSIHEDETQKPTELVQFNNTKTSISNTNSINIKKELTNVLKIDNDDFFNCPTQKLSFTKNTNLKPKVCSTVHDEVTQELIDKPIENIEYTSNSNTISKHKSSIQIPEIDNDFFNCPTQNISMTKKINLLANVSTIANKENTQKPAEFSQFNKIDTNIFKTNSTNIHKDFDEYTLNNHKQAIELDNKNRSKVQKSKCINSNTIGLSNVQIPVVCNDNSSNSSKINKPKIRVREDLCISYSGDSSNSTNILNKPNENTVMNNINTTVPLLKNINFPSSSKTSTDKETDINTLSSIKQEHLTDDFAQSRVSISRKHNHRLKRMDESIFSPLNIPDISTNSLSEHHSSPKTVEDNLNALNCKPSTSNNDASVWKSFWNKKKVQCQVKGKSDKLGSNKITHEVKENKERYQTRAMTKKENASILNRKRKQDGVEESNKKICTRKKILESMVENSLETVVSFSYLKSRHLQEMKQFVDKTGGTVTDDITECSVLVTDKIRCTMKILSAIARGCPIVNANWLKHSYTVQMFQDVDDFLIVDKDAERKYKFQLKESLAKAKTKKLLDGYNVLVTPSVKPGPQEMKVIISCAGGNYVLNWTNTQYSKELIVTCDKDRNRWKSAWDNDFAKIIDSDTLVTSIIRQKLTI